MKHEYDPLASVTVTSPSQGTHHILELGISGETKGLYIDHRRIVKISGDLLAIGLENAIANPSNQVQVDLAKHGIERSTALGNQKQLHTTNFTLKRALGLYPFWMNVQDQYAYFEAHTKGDLKTNFALF